MLDRNTLISIVVPVYNSEKFLADCLDSVIKQSYEHWELIVVIKAGSDNSEKILQEYQNRDQRIKVVPDKLDKGPGVARGIAVSLAQGEYVAFLDADDVWHGEKLKKQIGFMLRHEAAFTYTDYNFIDNSSQIDTRNIKISNSFTFQQYLKRRGIVQSSVMLKSEIISDEFKKLEPIQYAEDTALWLMLLKKGYVAMKIRSNLTFYRKHQNNRSSNVLKNQIWVWLVYRKVLGISAPAAFIYYLLYVFDVALRRIATRASRTSYE